MHLHFRFFALALLACANGAAFAQTRVAKPQTGITLQKAPALSTTVVKKLAPQAQAPDLVVSQFDLVPSNVQQSNSTGAVVGDVKFIFTIKNQGNQPIPKGWIAFRAYLNNRLLVANGPNDQSIVDAPGANPGDFWQLLEPGSSVVVTWQNWLGGVPAGSVTGKVEVRSIGDQATTLNNGTVVQPQESNTGNNVAQATISVP